MKKVLKVLLIVLIVILVIVIIGLAFLWFYPGVGKTPNKTLRKSFEDIEYYYDGAFHNVVDAPVMVGSYKKRSNTEVVPKNKIPVNKISEFPKNDGDFSITWLGHSTIMFQMNGLNILTDPVLTKYASPVNFIGSKRFSEVALEIENVPEVDVLLLSHDHYDHLDYPTIKGIDKKVKKYVVPLGVESYLIGWGIDSSKIVSLGWWDDTTIGGIKFTATPANHDSNRNPFKFNSTWWCGYHFTDETNSVYFTGDSGYIKENFDDIYERLGEVDVLLSDSAQYNDAWKYIHMNPLQALEVAKQVHAKYYIPIHWGVFALSDHDWYEPGKLAVLNASQYGIDVVTPRIGETVKYDKIDEYHEKWWEEVLK